MSRSRKRRATATKTSSRDADGEDAQSQSCAAAPLSTEERYVPRFGPPSTKRARTVAACTVSSSQPMQRRTRRSEEVSANCTSVEGSLSCENAASSSQKNESPTAGQCSSNASAVNSDATVAYHDGGSKAISEEVKRSQAKELVVADTLGSPYPTPSTPLHRSPLSQSTTGTVQCDDERQSAKSTGEHITHISGGHESAPALNSQHTSQLAPNSQHTSQPALNSQHSTNRDESSNAVLVTAACSDICMTTATELCKEPEVLGDDGGMNLELLDPLECNDEGEGEEGRVHGEGSHTQLEVNTESIKTDGDVPQSTPNPDDVIITQSAHNGPFTTLSPNHHSISQTSEVHTSIPCTTTPRGPTSAHSSQSSQQPSPTTDIVYIEECSEGEALPSLYGTDGDTNFKKMSGGVYAGESREVHGEGERREMCESGETREGVYVEEGVEDVVVVGGDDGQLLVGNNSQNHIKNEHDAVLAEGSPDDELLAVREMMDLTAHDLLESQLLEEEATVPSCSPLTTPTTRERGDTEQRGSSIRCSEMLSSSLMTAGPPPAVDGCQILRGLVEELSGLNQFVLACKRELDAGRRQRTAWMTSRHNHRGR